MKKTFLLLGRISIIMLLVIFMQSVLSSGRNLKIELYTPIIWFIQFLFLLGCIYIAIRLEEDEQK